MTMREKIARAIFETRLADEYEGVSFEHAMSRPRYLHIRQALEAQASAVLAALADPTPEMMRAVCEEMKGGGMDFPHPDDGDLDDLERHNFETLRAAVIAAIRAAGEGQSDANND